MGSDAAVSPHARPSQRARSVRCRSCWIGRTVGAIACALYVVLILEMWLHPGPPGTLRAFIVFLGSTICGFLAFLLIVWSFRAGCHTCK